MIDTVYRGRTQWCLSRPCEHLCRNLDMPGQSGSSQRFASCTLSALPSPSSSSPVSTPTWVPSRTCHNQRCPTPQNKAINSVHDTLSVSRITPRVRLPFVTMTCIHFVLSSACSGAYIPFSSTARAPRSSLSNRQRVRRGWDHHPAWRDTRDYSRAPPCGQRKFGY
jgi:hypothetical protein